MTLFSSESAPRFGSIGGQPMLPCPPLPNIVAEWAAILPLVCHLASQRDDYITTGDVALMGRLSVGIFPRLGTLSGFARLLRGGSKYLDYASTKGGSSRTVWDVNWGSVFPCANGAAIAAISKFLAARNTKTPQRMPETLSRSALVANLEKISIQDKEEAAHEIAASHIGRTSSSNKTQEDEPIRRYQSLKVYQFYYRQRKPSRKQRIIRLNRSRVARLIRLIISIGLAVVLSLWGCFGTAATILCNSISAIAVQSVTLRRPSGYLRNNENHDACMLVAAHENATEWHLYIGDRGIVDTVLNKPMFVIPEVKSTERVAKLLWFANLVQLGAMTFVAAQKGWDGVCLVTLLAIHWLCSSYLGGSKLVEDWLQEEGVDAKVETFEFGGRTAMLGAIQLMSNNPTANWMDRILVPHPRRAVWLRNLQGKPESGVSELEAHDVGWVKFATEASFAAAELLRPSYDYVVIGSGYGGSITASRLARAGQSICLLERGREMWPAGRGQSALVGNGLGGTSLINANVFLEADAATLAMDAWPPEIRNHPNCLAPSLRPIDYDKVRATLEPEMYPSNWSEPRKVDALKRQANSLGMGPFFSMVPQTTRFRHGLNSCGVEMSASTSSGQDCTGLNDGSKSTTLVTYLADAWNWGAEMFCQCEVRYVEKVQDSRGGYIVYFAWHGPSRSKARDAVYENLMWVHARSAVFFGAGSLGTTEILLRSKNMGLAMSDCIGRGMSGNGDILTFGYNSNLDVNAIGREQRSDRTPVGPTINSMIDTRSLQQHPLAGYVIQEGAIPQALSSYVQSMLETSPHGKAPEQTLPEVIRRITRRWKSRLLGPYAKDGAMQATQVFLAMSHDSSQATLNLENDEPAFQYVGVGYSDRIRRLHTSLEPAINAVGGTLVHSRFAAANKHQLTVHPLGGACMAADNSGRSGVTNHLGQVFVGSQTSETHHGLIVVDGALIPAALGVNPLATIAALAERAVAKYAKRNNLVINEAKNGRLDLFGLPAHRQAVDEGHGWLCPARAEVEFSELLHGFMCQTSEILITHRNQNDSYQAYAKGKLSGNGARLFVTTGVYGVRNAGNGSQISGTLAGTFVCPVIEGSPFMIVDGRLDLFKLDDTRSGSQRLVYDFDMTGVNGRRLHFTGYKLINGSVAFSSRRLWCATTSLYVTISERVPFFKDVGEDWVSIEQTRTVAMGMVRLTPSEFCRELYTLTALSERLWDRWSIVLAFLWYFASHLLLSFFKPFNRLEYPSDGGSGYLNPTPATQVHIIQASDGVCIELKTWEAAPRTTNGVDILMIPGGAVDHQIFSLPTIPMNAVNYFTRAGYRVSVPTLRIGRMGKCQKQWTTYDARLDIAACFLHIRKMNHGKKIYTIAHCLGSVALASGLLDGTIPACWILGLTCSQVFMNPIWSGSNSIKMNSPAPPDRTYNAVAGPWFDCRASKQASVGQRLLDEALRFYPVATHETCNNATCHRISMLFGRCWNHQNLNEATHLHMDRFFGAANMTMMELLMCMGKHRQVMSNAPALEQLVSAENVSRLRGFPIMLFVGGDNAVISPAATELTYEQLCEAHGLSAGCGGGIQYRRRVVPGYGHLDCWMGTNAWRDVFPFVLDEMNRVMQG
ncbi:hypothetical protein HJFPF1_10603 [Paramyrothecium foliicola]|nr:hypothetical protein HJFPF1_10603 [Paramyrothecium foliicola]